MEAPPPPFRRRRFPRDATPEPESRGSDARSGREAALGIDQDGGLIDPDCADARSGLDALWWFFDVFAWLFGIVALVVGIAVWVVLLAGTLTGEFLKWCFTPRGLIVLLPSLVGGALLGTWAALAGDFGTASAAFVLLDLHGGSLARVLEQVSLSEIPLPEKSLAGGLLARRSAAELMAERGHAEALGALLAAGRAANDGWILGPFGFFGTGSPLAAAAKHGHTSALRLLLAAHAQPDLGWRYGPRGLLGGSTPLAEAARGGHVDAMRLLVDVNVSVDIGWQLGAGGVLGDASPLRAAASSGHLAAVELLLAAKASPDRGTSVGPLGLFWSDAPLLGATWNGDLAMVRALLAAGASLEHSSGEELRKAALLGHGAIVEALLGAGAVPDREGKALQGAVRNGHTSVAQMLMKATAQTTS
mmetsp:Transcript_151208/g.485728  ORF Transcript_151208/g.485728 Transcript_151208/m.485728 type:complete len:418 (-) Transcript_151208:26-1279(-)